jgi:hypothetical protein
MAMMDPQRQRPTSESPRDASRGTRPNGPAAGPTPPPRRVGVYERLRRSTGLSPAITWSLALVILAIIIVLIVVFLR